MTTERTFAIIKPDAVKAGHAGKILARIEAAGFALRGMRLQHLSKKEAEGFYAVHKERPFFAELTTFMSSGPCVLLCLEATDAIRKWRDTMGPTDPAKADRARCAVTLARRLATTPRTDRMRRRRRRSSWVLLQGNGAYVRLSLRLKASRLDDGCSPP
jgi:nucleoside-diphosphate kinase